MNFRTCGDFSKGQTSCLRPPHSVLGALFNLLPRRTAAPSGLSVNAPRMRMCVQFLLGRGSIAFRRGLRSAGVLGPHLVSHGQPPEPGLPWGSFIHLVSIYRAPC